MKILNQISKIPYEYERIWYNDLSDDKIAEFLLLKADGKRKQGNNGNSAIARRIPSFTVGKGKYGLSYFYICMSFDIETYTDVNSENAIPYIWQCGINNNVILGRYEHDFIDLLGRIKEMLKPTERQRVIILDHNLSYEMGFYIPYLNLVNAQDNFLKDRHQFLKITHDNFFEFRDTLALTQSSLKELAKNFCNTQKAVGDLDYTLPRNHLTELDPNTELVYCDNDVLILTEYADKLFNDYIKQHKKIPLTNTGKLTDICKTMLYDSLNNEERRIDNWHLYNVMRFPQSLERYEEMVNFLYRGGFVHCDMLYADELLTGETIGKLLGADITSSYPYCMTCKIYPETFTPTECSFENIERLINEDKCVIMKIRFVNIKSTGLHSIESKSKCITLVNELIDNGRVLSADEMTVWLTEYDYISYTRFYTWDTENTEVLECECSEKRWLYGHLVKSMLQFYKAKANLKAQHLPYSTEKVYVNTYYGKTCKRLNFEMSKIDNSGYSTDSAKPYEEQIRKSDTCVYDGVYISAFARFRLLDMAWNMSKYGVRSIYCDTDSHKFINMNEQAYDYLNAYNADIERTNVEHITHFTEWDECYRDLGTFDIEYNPDGEHKIIGFKTLGAKRYIVTYLDYDKKLDYPCIRVNQTIAGLPKTQMLKMFKNPRKVYRAFEDELNIPNCKLRTKYNDTATELTVIDYQGNTETAYIPSNIALIPTSFSMSVNGEWLAMALSYIEDMMNDGKEFRIY